jgi:phosphoribosyl 1,2-cyclic phosphodiesterase
MNELQVTSLNSGSNGNCYYVGNGREAVLIDAGCSCREIEKRMQRLGLSIHLVKAVFISHEHSDHIKGVEVLSRKYKIPVYFTETTYKHSRLEIHASLLKFFEAYTPVRIGSLKVLGFPKLHDAADPHSFVVEGQAVKIGILTDIGTICRHVVQNFKQCHAVFLEANYDVKMLEEGHYPFYLKNRINGTHGHLSNTQSLGLFKNHKPPFMSHVFLSHLSKDNNCPVLVRELFQKYAFGTHVDIASRYNEMEVYTIGTSILRKARKSQIAPNLQMSLFAEQAVSI